MSLTSTTLLLTTLVPGPGGEIAGLGRDPANVDAIVRIAADGTTLQIAPDACGAYGARTLTFAPDDAGLPSYGILAGNGGAGIGLCWRAAADVAADAGHDTQSSVNTFQVLDAVPLSIDRQGALVAAASSNPDRMSFDRTGLTGLTAVPACAQLGTRAVPRQIGGGRYSAVFLMSGTVDGGAVSCLTMPDGGFVNFGSAQVSGYDLGALAVEPSDGGVFVGGTYGGKTYLAVNPAPFSIANALAAAQPGRVVSVAANAGEVAYVSVLGADGLEYLSAWYPDGGGPTVPIEGFLPEPGGGLMGRPLIIANDGQVWLTTDAGLFRWTP